MANEPSNGPGGRPYRSKKQRPCDRCRSRKAQCRILDGDATCELCKRLARDCTFILQPSRKEPRPHSGGDPTAGQQAGQGRYGLEDSQEPSPSLPMPQQDDYDFNMASDATSTWLPLEQGGCASAFPNVSHLSQMDWSSLGVTTERPSSEVAHTSSGQLQTQENTAVLDPSKFPEPTVAFSSGEFTNNGNDDAPHLAQRHEPSPGRMSQIPQSVQGFDWPMEFSSDFKEGYSNQSIGSSGESDPFLLRYYLYNVYDTYPMFRLDFRKIMGDERMNPGVIDDFQAPVGSIPIQFVMSDENIYEDDNRTSAEMSPPGDTSEACGFASLESLVPADVSGRSFRLYARFVHSQFPVLSTADLIHYSECRSGTQLPIGIIAAVYASAIPFSFLDDELSVSKGYRQPSTEELWAIAHRSYQHSSRSSHLSSLQLCLLSLQMPPRNYAVADTPNTWALSCAALGLAQGLGLNMDPARWRLPQGETRLRRRSWWMTYIQHTWSALLLGRPSHLHDDDWDVSHPTLDDDLDIEQGTDQDIRDLVALHFPIFLALCRSTDIAARVLKELYTLKAARDCHSLDTILARAQPLRILIETWRRSLPSLSAKVSTSDDESLGLYAPLRLSHSSSEVLIYRALQRPSIYQTSAEPASMIFENSYVCSKSGVESVETFKPKQFSMFWPQYSRYHLCYISSLISMSFAQAPTKEIAMQNRALLSKWHITLRTQARVWPLAKLATMRLDAVFWKGSSAVVHGTGPDSPALLSLKEQGSQASIDT